MTFEQYQADWNALKAGVISCAVAVPLAIERLMSMNYTWREAETEIQNWLFEGAMNNPQLRPSDAYHKIKPESAIIDNRSTS